MLHWVLIVAATAAGAAPPTLREPLQGAVVGGRVLTAAEDKTDWGYVRAWTVPLGKDGPARESAVCGLSPGLPLRWSAGHGGFWLGNAMGNSGPDGGGPRYMGWMAADILDRLDLGALLKGRAVHDQAEDDDKSGGKRFAPREPAQDARILTGPVHFRAELYYDSLPVARYGAQQFVLTNVRGKVGTYGKTGLLEAGTIHTTWEEESTPLSSFTVHGYEGRWNAKTQNWAHGTWKKVGTIDVAFREPFRVLSRGEDYYFLTSSGALYRAPKPAKGRHRKMLPVWVNRRDPITAFIKDVDRDRTFLFHGPRERPAVFEMAEGVRDRPYDPKLFVTGKEGPDALRRVVGYSRVLLALGMVNRK